MEILVQSRIGGKGYSIIALRRYWSNGFQRFFVCNLQEGPEGALLTGVMRGRKFARWFLTLGLGFLSLVFAIMLMTTFVMLGRGQIGQALRSAEYLLFVLLFAVGVLGFANVSMMLTASNEKYLISWLAILLT
jgi:hypothetical protein